jgi:hypothetical protein
MNNCLLELVKVKCHAIQTIQLQFGKQQVYDVLTDDKIVVDEIIGHCLQELVQLGLGRC